MRPNAHLCDCCGEPSTDLQEVDFVSNVVLPECDPKHRYTRAEIHGAPSVPARWCAGCLREHAKWKRSSGNAEILREMRRRPAA